MPRAHQRGERPRGRALVALRAPQQRGTADRRRVAGFAFRVGDPIPRRDLERFGLPDGGEALEKEEVEGIKTKARRYGFSSLGPWP